MMKLFQIVSMEPLEPYQGAKYICLACTATSYLFLSRGEKKLRRHCHGLHFQEEISTTRAYTGICYDCTNQCYWACCSKNSDTIYRLTDKFIETDRLRFCAYEPTLGNIRAITYSKRDDCLFLTYCNQIIAIDKETGQIKDIRCCDCDAIYHAFCCSVPYDYCISRRHGIETISVLKGCEPVICAYLPKGYRILSIDKAHCSDGVLVTFLALKHNSYHVLIKGMLTDCDISQIIPHCCDCQHQIHEKNCIDGRCEEHDDFHCCCEEETHSHAHDLHHSCTDVIQSVALEQTAISHILNAEGEKIQKAVAISSAPADLLDVNESVMETVTKLTHLEQVLHAKLELACRMLRKFPPGS